MRVVIDTNVFVSSFLGGNPRKIIDLWKEGRIFLCLSKAVLDEYMEVLLRLGLEKEKELGELLSLFGSGYNLTFTMTTPTLNVVDRDPDDDEFIECAVALEADFIISADQALLEIEEFGAVRIVSSKEFLALCVNNVK